MSEPIACPACRRAFTPRAGNQQYCSDRCGTLARVRRFRRRVAASRPDSWGHFGLKTLDELLPGFAPPPPTAPNNPA